MQIFIDEFIAKMAEIYPPASERDDLLAQDLPQDAAPAATTAKSPAPRPAAEATA